MCNNSWKRFRFVGALSILSWAGFLCVGASDVFASPGFGSGNCNKCHGDGTPPAGAALSVSGTSGNLIVNPRLDTGITTSLPMYTVTQGQSINLTMKEITSDGTFDVALTGTPASGSKTGNLPATNKGIKTLLTDILGLPTPSPASGWSQLTDTAGSIYYWQAGVSNSDYTFNLNVPVSTPVDVYSLTFRAAGPNGVDGKWNQSQEILINVVSNVPEPATVVLLLSAGGIAACAFWRRRRQKQ
jgi:hypothetical protein